MLFASGLVVYASTAFTVNCTNGIVNAVDSVAVVGCLLPGGGSYTGDVDVVETPTTVLMRMTNGGFTGANNGAFPIVTAGYFLLGEGVERAGFNGTLAGIAAVTTNGAEAFAVAVEGTSFTNNPANAFWTGPGAGVAFPIPVVAGPNTVQEDFLGSGSAYLFVQYNTGGGTTYSFPTSVDGELATPEPGTWMLALPLAAVVLAGSWKKRRRNHPRSNEAETGGPLRD
jgi:hypothetical protein